MGMTTNNNTGIDRNEAIATIKANLKARSGKTWSVKGGRGTAWGWITVTAPPARLDVYGGMTNTDRTELADLFNVPGDVHHQGISIPASSDYRRFYIALSAGEAPGVEPTPYWD